MNLLVIYTDDENKKLFFTRDADAILAKWAVRVDRYALGYDSLSLAQEEDAYDFINYVNQRMQQVSTPLSLDEPVLITTIHMAL